MHLASGWTLPDLEVGEGYESLSSMQCMQLLHVPQYPSNALYQGSLEAAVRSAPYVLQTPVQPSTWLAGGNKGGLTVNLKLESEQHTGSFKVRGAVNKVGSKGQGMRLQVRSAAPLLTPGQVVARATEACWWNHYLLHWQPRPGLPLCMQVPAAAAGPFISPRHCHATAACVPALICQFVQGGLEGLAAVHPSFVSRARALVSRRMQVARLRAEGTADILLHGADCVEAELLAASVAAERGACYISPYNDFEAGISLLHLF